MVREFGLEIQKSWFNIFLLPQRIQTTPLIQKISGHYGPEMEDGAATQ